MPDPRTAYLRQSEVTDPGLLASVLDVLPADLRSLRSIARGLVFHYRADGDLAANGIAAGRLGEIDTRYADLMLQRLIGLAPRPLAEPRLPAERLVGCSRDVTLLLVTMARHKGIPARSRVGFASYFAPGWFLDHVVAEIWDAAAGRWRLVEAQVADGCVDGTDGARLDVLDVPPDRFVTGPAAWLACREGRADPARFAVDPDLAEPMLRSWPYLAHNLVHDLASLNRREMILWDDWGAAAGPDPLPPPVLELLDALAAATSAPDPDVGELTRWLALPQFEVPPTVTSCSPADSRPALVGLRPARP